MFHSVTIVFWKATALLLLLLLFQKYWFKWHIARYMQLGHFAKLQCVYATCTGCPYCSNYFTFIHWNDHPLPPPPSRSTFPQYWTFSLRHKKGSTRRYKLCPHTCEFQVPSLRDESHRQYCRQVPTQRQSVVTRHQLDSAAENWFAGQPVLTQEHTIQFTVCPGAQAYPGFYNGRGSRGGGPGNRVWGMEVPQWVPGAILR